VGKRKMPSGGSADPGGKMPSGLFLGPPSLCSAAFRRTAARGDVGKREDAEQRLGGPREDAEQRLGD